MRILKYHFIEKESNITIISESKEAILKAQKEFYIHRQDLDNYVKTDKLFLTSFSPIKVKTDLRIVKLMIETAYICDVGPMATVAGAFADLMLESMKEKGNKDFTPAQVALVENGGEIAINSEKPMRLALYAGDNELNLNLGFLIKKEDCPIGVATSSATVGHAISLGQADAVTIFAKNATLADGAATAIANKVKGEDLEQSIKKGLDAVEDIEGVLGAFISRGNRVGQVGKIPQIIKIEGDKSRILKAKIEDSIFGDYEILK